MAILRSVSFVGKNYKAYSFITMDQISDIIILTTQFSFIGEDELNCTENVKKLKV